MKEYEAVLDRQETVSARLRHLYSSWGFRPYKISRFEEYDLYMRYKSFLKDERILTFTDTDGKLMALKPDITLSVVKNCREEDYPLRVCYLESVFRVPQGAMGFREITQTGVESIGRLEEWDYCENLLLAALSLRMISPGAWRLDVSDQGILSELMKAEGLPEDAGRDLLPLIGAKNRHGVLEECGRLNVSGAFRDQVAALMALSGLLSEAAEQAMALPLPAPCLEKLAALKQMGLAAEALGLEGVCLDFSVVNDMSYYNGLVFSGFVEGVFVSVLSGGRYDPVLRRMGKSGSAVGFAVYLDQLSRLFPEESFPFAAPGKPEGATLAEMALHRAEGGVGK
ncbi:MAG: ATP phosphoribosyltransferase regulatory subunit [Clostridia bacterium]|nr:ATP phosphoribosyltransferase regulatory subunit [Clostridia bacterium]